MRLPDKEHADWADTDHADRSGCGELAGVRYCCFCGNSDVLIDIQESRVQCRQCHKTLYFNSKPAVAAVILRGSQVLLVTDCAREEQWDLPGGFLRYAESPQDGLKRELREELDADIQIEELFAAALDRYGPESAWSLNLFYRASLLSEHIRSRSEIEAHAWFRLDALPSIKYKSTSDILSELRRFSG